MGGLKLFADSDGRYGSDEVNTSRVDIDVDAVGRLEDAHEPSVEDLGDAVAADGRVGCDAADCEAEPSRSVRRPVENGDGHAVGW